ncbi:16S rRNA (cytosine(967)-C(5))-methyltransferase, partial [hydrothermal vent metagenome]
LLELQPAIELDILEKEAHRLELVKGNLNRLNLKAYRLIEGDATQPKTWLQGAKYDKILLDVPCSAAGVVRRNPDIKLLRQPQHIKQLTDLQQQILQQMADLVNTGGQILYATCSVFRSENERQIKKFLQQQPNFKTIDLDIRLAEKCLHGQQIITGSGDMDGFYYCLLEKTA